MGFDLGKQFLEVLNDRAVDSPAKVGVVIGNLPCLIADAIKHVLVENKTGETKGRRGRLTTYLETTFTAKLIT